jgi:hypothetical protein
MSPAGSRYEHRTQLWRRARSRSFEPWNELNDST